jgi:3-isopropylmalate dehydrogenase
MKITVLPGDGIGPEVTNQAVLLLSELAPAFQLSLEFEEHLIGGAAIRQTGSPFPEETRAACLDSDAVLLGAVGSPEFDDQPLGSRPETGLLQLRKALGGFANLRPAKAYPALIGSSPLRPQIWQGTDLMIVRELLGGIYFGEPRAVSSDEAFNTLRYTRAEIERVARTAFEIARSRKKSLVSVDKANVLETSQLWRRTVSELGEQYPDVRLEHLYVDACAMHLVTDPSRFDVILTENMFGDILSDEAAVLTGSLGMLASATIGGEVDLYEPVHGSAPDIAGRNIANPVAAIASAAMLLRYSLKNNHAANAIEDAIEKFIDNGYRTADLASASDNSVSTTDAGSLLTQYALEYANISHAYHAV